MVTGHVSKISNVSSAHMRAHTHMHVNTRTHTHYRTWCVMSWNCQTEICNVVRSLKGNVSLGLALLTAQLPVSCMYIKTASWYKLIAQEIG